MSGIGHNSGEAEVDVLNGTAQRQLRAIIERVERLNVEKAEVLESIKEVFAEAKGNGFDVKVLRKIIRLRQMDPAKVQEEEAITDLYMAALGETPREPEEPAEDHDDIA